MVAVVVVSETHDRYVGLRLVVVVQVDGTLHSEMRNSHQPSGQHCSKPVYDACMRWMDRWHSSYEPIDQFRPGVGRENAYLTDVVVLRYGEPIVFLGCYHELSVSLF